LYRDVFSLESRQHDNASVCKLGPDRDHRLNAAHIRKSQIHQGDVGPMLSESMQGLAAACSFGHERHIWLVPDDGGDSLSKKGVIIDTQNANAALIDHTIALSITGVQAR
jgi:hypothetical protein